MFKNLLNKLKKWLKKEVVSNANDPLAGVKEKAVDEIFANLEEVAAVADVAAENIEKEIVEAVKEVKKKGRPSTKTSGTTKKSAPKKKA